MAVVSSSHAMQIRKAHLMTMKVSHEFGLIGFQQISTLFWLIVIVVGIGAACWYMRGCFERTNNAVYIVVPPTVQRVDEAPQLPSRIPSRA